MKRTIATALVAVFALGLSAKDIKTFKVTTTPQMHCESCENKIKDDLRFEKGMKKIETDIPSQTITITYDADKNTEEAIIKAFEKIGYEARKVEADSDSNR